MIRPVLIGLCAAALAGPALAGQPVSLRHQPTAGPSGVTLGDLFEGVAGPAAKVVVAPAPAPGLNAVLDAPRVQMAAKAAGLDWDNALGARRIVVAGPLPGAAPARAAERPARAVQVLAYARNIAAGEIVGPADLVWSDQAVAPADSPGDPDAVIGMSARRPLRAGAPVLSRDVSAPVVVRRDEAVSVAFQSGGITLTLQGKALKDAAVGEPVQVLNLQSKKVVEAVAAGPGRAVVGPAAEALKARPFLTASLR